MRPYVLPSDSRRLGAAALLVLFLVFLGTSMTRVFRDPHGQLAPSTGIMEMDANNYYAMPRMRAQGLPLETTHELYIVHVPLLSVLGLPMALVLPDQSHLALRWGTLLLHALLTAWVGWRLLTRVEGSGRWPLAVLALWGLSPGLWALARTAYSEWYVGLALFLALMTIPRRGGRLSEAAWGGAAMGLLVASKMYGVIPAAVVGSFLAYDAMVARSGLSRLAVFALTTAASACALWGLASVLYGVDPMRGLSHVFQSGDAWAQQEANSRWGVLLGLPRAWTARLPGAPWMWVLLLACLRCRPLLRRIQPRVFLAWASAFAVPYVISPAAYRLWPLLVALPALVLREPVATDSRRARAETWMQLLVDVALVANVGRWLVPELRNTRSHWLTVWSLALVLSARGWFWLPSLAAIRERLRPVGLALLPTACAVALVYGIGWQVTDWAAPDYRWDASAREVRERRPDAASVAGLLPELWCRYLEDARSLDTLMALVPLPVERTLEADVIVTIENRLGPDFRTSIVRDREVWRERLPWREETFLFAARR